MGRENLISADDGLVAKKGEWRSSFSFSERNLVGLYLELYQALKYLNKVTLPFTLEMPIETSLQGVREPHRHHDLPLEGDLLRVYHQPGLQGQEEGGGEFGNVTGEVDPVCGDPPNRHTLLWDQTRQPDVFLLSPTVQQGSLHIRGGV